MFISIKDREDLENLNGLVSLENQVQAVRLQGKLAKQNFHKDLKKVFETATKSTKDVSEEVTKTMTVSFFQNNQAIENLNNKLQEIMNDRGIIASYLLSPLSKITNPENSSPFNLVEDSQLKRIKDLKTNKTIPITLYNNLLTLIQVKKSN